MTQCRSCGADIRFIRTQKGKMLPVDVQEHLFSSTTEGDETYITIDGKTHAKGKRIEPKAEQNPVIGYTPHWATCPFADLYRKRGTK